MNVPAYTLDTKNHILVELGRGSFKEVFVISKFPDVVYKKVTRKDLHDKEVQMLIKGYGAGLPVARLLAYTSEWIVQERCIHMVPTGNQLMEFVTSARQVLTEFAVQDFKPRNLGFLRGKLVALDFITMDWHLGNSLGREEEARLEKRMKSNGREDLDRLFGRQNWEWEGAGWF